MGRIAEDVARLAGEIRCGRRDRQQMIRGLRHDAAARKREVGRMRAGFRAARAEMSRRQKKALMDFAVGIVTKVSWLLRSIAGDLSGARRAWMGASSFHRGSRGGGASRNEQGEFRAPAEAENKAAAAARPDRGAAGPQGDGRRRKKRHA